MWDEIRKCVIGGLAAIAMSGAAHAEEPSDAPVVVELFTAQNCAFCPPANAYLGKLAERDDVIALSFIVDYWDSPEYAHLPNHTRRQRAYGWLIGKDRVYTPEMVIGGERHATGYRKLSVNGKIKAQKKEQNGSQIAIGAEETPGFLKFMLPAEEGETGMYEVILIPFKSEMTVSTRPGPDDDRTYTNVAFRPRTLGTWAGKERNVTIGISDDTNDEITGFTLFVQEPNHGPIKGAKMVRLKGRS